MSHLSESILALHMCSLFGVTQLLSQYPGPGLQVVHGCAKRCRQTPLIIAQFLSFKRRRRHTETEMRTYVM